MSQFSSLKVGGPAEAIISVANVDDLKSLILWLKDHDIGWWVVGRGSNILVPDSGLAGVIIVLEGDFNTIEKLAEPTPTNEKQVFVRTGAGCLLPKLVNYCTSQGLTGLEFAIGIPGSIGGAIVMNAGAWGYEIGNLVDSVVLMDHKGEASSEQGINLGFLYRKWSMPQNTLLLSATFALKPGSKDNIKAACKRYQEMRIKNQPIAEHSAGSFFKNPPDDSAGRLIEEAGLKGFSVGGAKISEKHANFIVNTGTASAADILDIMQIVQQEVFKHFGIKLEPEVHILGGE
ncbi:MAG: UDP-N-acetylmuramate dehydrogenase [Deltaproteobacteria bacterium]|nr:MAG: UDP-N-acetylmuramate dehydrogenase [Deltaproteobacteria bacterium]